MDYFKLYACCIPVNGSDKSIIYDLGRGDYFEIDNLVYDVLDRNEEMSISELMSSYENAYDQGIRSYFDLFEEQEIGFYTDSPESFPSLDMTWNSPHRISNAILEFDSTDSYDIKDVLMQLNDLACKDIQLIFLSPLSIEWLAQLLDNFTLSRFKSYQIFLPFNESLVEEDYISLIKTYKRVAGLVIYDSDQNKTFDNDRLIASRLFFTESSLDYSRRVDKNNFVINISVFTEAQMFNAGLNRKVCVSKDGSIKNYLSFRESFGNVNDSAIRNVIKEPKFQEKWHISNNQIEKCKICAYRYMCISNSDLLLKKDKWYKITPCEFNKET